jgi:hypothetical protein
VVLAVRLREPLPGRPRRNGAADGNGRREHPRRSKPGTGGPPIPLHAFGTHTRLPRPNIGNLFFDPRQVTNLLSSTGWRNVQIDAVTEPARIGSNAADVMSYVRGMPMVRNLAADIGDEALTERVLAAIAEQYSARQGPDGVWVRAAAWLVTAHRG